MDYFLTEEHWKLTFNGEDPGNEVATWFIPPLSGNGEYFQFQVVSIANQQIVFDFKRKYEV